MTRSRRRVLGSLQRKNLALLLLALLGTIPYGLHAAASLACGGGIGIVNLAGLERSVGLLTRRAADGRGAGMRPLLFLRFALLVAVVGALLLATPIAPIPFVIGLSTLVPAALWHGLEPERLREGS